MVQLDLPSYASEVRAADQAIARAEHNAPSQWVEHARSIVRQVALTHTEFISDACWAAGLQEPPEPRALGAIMRWAAREGLIVGTDEFRTSSRRGCHGMQRRVWRSLVHEGA